MKNKLKYITKHISNLHPTDCGAINIWESDGVKLVDIEWSDGVSAFVLEDVLQLIKEKGSVTKSELIDYCLPR